MCNLSEGVEQRGIEIGLQRGRSEGIDIGIQQGRSEGIDIGIQKGLAQGLTQGLTLGEINGRIADIKSLQTTLGITFVEAMELLRIPKDQQSAYLEKGES